MKITSTIPFAVDDVLLGREVATGETVDVTADQAQHRLAETTNWVPADDEAAVVLASLTVAPVPADAIPAPEPVPDPAPLDIPAPTEIQE